MGDAFESLPAEVQAFHDGTSERRWVGTSEIRRGRGPLARLAAVLFGFPRAGAAVPTSVVVSPGPAGETWTRDFGGRRLRSVQWAGEGRDAALLFERFGPVSVGSALILDGDRLRIVPRKGSVFGLPMPAWLLPSGEAFEAGDAGRFRFDVAIHAPLVGLVVAYRGWLSLQPPGDGADQGRAMRSQGTGGP